MLSASLCYDALLRRDHQYDGCFFIGVATTRIYCRPICPAGPALFRNCRFYPSEAAAQLAGFRPCLRCHPECAPQLSLGLHSHCWRALAYADGNWAHSKKLTPTLVGQRLGLSGVQLSKLFNLEYGASFAQVIEARRLLQAKQLLDSTPLSLPQVAHAAGFSKLERFTDAFHRVFRRSPLELKRKYGRLGVRRNANAAHETSLLLSYAAPYSWPTMLAHLAARAIEGVEQVTSQAYRRTFRDGRLAGVVEVSHEPERRSLRVDLAVSDLKAVPCALARVRRVFDLGVSVPAVHATLAADACLAPLVQSAPGLRVPGGWDGFELGVRAILGQQVTLQAARGLLCQLVRLCAVAVGRAQSVSGLDLHFPDPDQLLNTDLSALKVTSARRVALRAFAEAMLADPFLCQPRGTLEDTIAQLLKVKGIGSWTAHYIALRMSREPDAFPDGDVVLQRCYRARKASDWPELSLYQQHWRPFRAYAAQYLWALGNEPPTLEPS